MLIMRRRLLESLFLAAAALGAQTASPPASWVDPDTGHRVVRLTNEPDSASLYFNQNGYTADRKKLVYTTPDGISVLDLATHKMKQVVQGRARLIDAGRKTQRVYYLSDGAAFYTDVDAGESRKFGDLPRSTPTKRCSPARTSKAPARTTAAIARVRRIRSTNRRTKGR